MLGLLSGYNVGWIDNTIMRLIDILVAFPGLRLAITIIAVLGVGEQNVNFAIGVFSVPVFAQVLRHTILSLKQQEFVTAARALGASAGRLMVAHLLPNAVAPVLVISTLRLGTAILTAATLSFLGLGIRPPLTRVGCDAERRPRLPPARAARRLLPRPGHPDHRAHPQPAG